MMTASSVARTMTRMLKRRIVVRVLLLLLAGVSIYLLLPSLLEIFSSWPQLRELDPLWLGLAVFFEGVSSLAYWALQRIAFQTRSWFAVGTSQLASAAATRVLPGGAAAASALQYGMLVRAGLPPQSVASGVAASWAATTATVLALPVIAVLAGIGGSAVPHGLRNVAYLGAAAFVVMTAVGAAAFLWDRPLRLVGGANGWNAFPNGCSCSGMLSGARSPRTRGWRSSPRSAGGVSTTWRCSACSRRSPSSRSRRSSCSHSRRRRSSA
jgi:hypothetical protein